MNLSEFEPEFKPMDPRLEQAVNEIRSEAAEPAVVEAAAERVWARLAASHDHLRSCADFQALLPDYRAARLSDARATLVKDHLHECVACRRVYEGRVVTMPAARPARRAVFQVRWAAAAVVVLAAGVAVWFALEQYGVGSGRAVVQSVNGTLFAVAADGTLHPLAAGQDLPDGVEIRAARDSGAMLQLRDGSLVELHERAAISTSADASDLTVRLSRGSIIVQAAKRRRGHLYVATADCRVAVTGTVFSVVSGVKGSRVSVVEGTVHVTQDNQDRVLHPGDQVSTSTSIEPQPVRDDIGWSRNRDRLIQQLGKLRIEIQAIHLPALRYQSRLLNRLPADTALFASIPNLGQYLAEAEAVFGKNLEQSPELRAWWAGRSGAAESVIDKLRAASEYLGDEVVVVGRTDAAGKKLAPVFLAETKREGFPEFLKHAVPGVAVATRPGLVAFGPDAQAVETLMASLDSTSAEFRNTPFYARIAEAYQQGAGILVCADFSRFGGAPLSGVRYLTAEQKEIRDQRQMRATLGFAGDLTGMASWLDAPAPMGSLDYVSPDATFVAGFVVRDPNAIVDQVAAVGGRLLGSRGEPTADTAGLRKQLAGALGGEFSLSFDGPIFPPSWKLVTEVYDPARAQAAIRQMIDTYNQQAAKGGGKPLRTGTETVDGRVYYMIAAADPNPLTEAHYTFADGYLIAGPTRALVAKALQTKLAGTSITHSAGFVALEPSDHFANFSAVVYENLGTTLKPLVGLLGSFAPPQAHANGGLDKLGDIKPLLIAAYASRDQLTFAATGEGLPFGPGGGLASLMSGNLAGVFGHALPMGRMQGGRR